MIKQYLSVTISIPSSIIRPDFHGIDILYFALNVSKINLIYQKKEELSQRVKIFLM